MGTIKNVLFIAIMFVFLNGCARDGGIGKEGIFEALKSIDKSRNPTVGTNKNWEGMSYREYESMRRDSIE